MNIQVRKFSFESKYDNVMIHGTCMVPDDAVGIFVMVHGMCEHRERYIPFMREMARRGFITAMHDNRGHGESMLVSEDIGYCYDSMEVGYVSDLYKVVRRMKKEYPNLPLILYGHSMGTLINRVFLRNHDSLIDGLILAGAPSYNSLVPSALWALKQVKKWKGDRYRSKTMQQIVLGAYQKKFKKDGGRYAWLTSDVEERTKYVKDKKCIFTYTLNGFEALLNMEYITYKAIGYQMENPDLPILFASGMDDPCYSDDEHWEHMIQRMRDLGYYDIWEIRYDNMRHEIHNELERQKVFDDYESFCRKVIEKNLVAKD